jgi:Flp pilus assembly pilin Flp
MQSDQPCTASAYDDGPYADEREGADLARRHATRRGQGLVEYVLIILFVALAVMLALSLLAPTINSIFNAIPPAL